MALETRISQSMAHFVEDNKGLVFRYWIYRRMFTPHEQDKKYADESIYEDTVCNRGYITDCVDLHNGDYLLGFEDAEAYHNKELKRNIQFCRLSEIRLECYEGDQEEYSLQEGEYNE